LAASPYEALEVPFNRKDLAMSESESDPGPIVFRPIGVIRSEHVVPEKTPIQPIYARVCAGRAEVLPEFADGLRDLDGFSHVYLLYAFHRAESPRLVVQPFTDDKPHGVFSTRHPRRPNPLGLSIVRLVRVEGTTLYLEGVDILDGTPLLDIKPYVPRFDTVENPRGGWTEDVDDATAAKRGRRGFVSPSSDSPKDPNQ